VHTLVRQSLALAVSCEPGLNTCCIFVQALVSSVIVTSVSPTCFLCGHALYPQPASDDGGHRSSPARCRYQREVPPLPALGGGSASVFSAQPMVAPQYAGAPPYGASGYGGIQAPPYAGQVTPVQLPARAVVAHSAPAND